MVFAWGDWLWHRLEEQRKGRVSWGESYVRRGSDIIECLYMTECLLFLCQYALYYASPTKSSDHEYLEDYYGVHGQGSLISLPPDRYTLRHTSITSRHIEGQTLCDHTLPLELASSQSLLLHHRRVQGPRLSPPTRSPVSLTANTKTQQPQTLQLFPFPFPIHPRNPVYFTRMIPYKLQAALRERPTKHLRRTFLSADNIT